MKNHFLLTPLIIISSLLYNTVCAAHTNESIHSKKNNDGPMIIGGDDSAQGEFPFMVSLLQKGRPVLQTFCGASLIDKKYVLTAAHCLGGGAAKPSDLEVALNFVDSQNPGDAVIRRSIKNIFNFNSVSDNDNNGDIAILELEMPITEVAPIKLASPEIWEQIKLGDTLTVIGFGVTVPGGGNPSEDDPLGGNETTLKKVNVPLYDRETCRKNYADAAPDGGGLTVNEDNICAGYAKEGFEEKDSCAGDSGGPLFYTKDNTRYQVGVVSWGSQRCAEPDFPGVYTHVTYYLNWIEAITSGVDIPNEKQIGFTEPNANLEGSIMVKNNSDETFSVTEVSFSDASNVMALKVSYNACENKPISKDQSCEIGYSFTSDQPGEGKFSVEIATSHSRSPKRTVENSVTIMEAFNFNSKELLDIEDDNLVSWYKSGEGTWEANSEEASKGNASLAASAKDNQDASIMMKLDPRVKNVTFDYWVDSDDVFYLFNGNSELIKRSGIDQISFDTKSIALSDKVNRLIFSYRKDGPSRSDPGRDTAFIDNLRFDVRNTAPDIKVSAVKSAQAESTVQIDASKTTDPEKDTMTYSWKILGDTLGATISGEDSNTLKLKLGSQTGNLHYQLTVRDQYGAESMNSGQFKIEAKPEKEENPEKEEKSKSSGSFNITLLWLILMLVVCRFNQYAKRF
jgi:secreted trypsin-like serine protease